MAEANIKLKYLAISTEYCDRLVYEPNKGELLKFSENRGVKPLFVGGDGYGLTVLSDDNDIDEMHEIFNKYILE